MKYITHIKFETQLLILDQIVILKFIIHRIKILAPIIYLNG